MVGGIIEWAFWREIKPIEFKEILEDVSLRVILEDYQFSLSVGYQFVGSNLAVRYTEKGKEGTS